MPRLLGPAHDRLSELGLPVRSGTGTAAGYPIPRWWLLACATYSFGSSALHVLRTAMAPAAGGPVSRPGALEEGAVRCP